jgi:Tol biopolymer transport system component
MRLEIATPPTPAPAIFAISPDGRFLVFVASSDGPTRLWLRPLAATTARPLAGTEGANFPFWDPESRSVAFFAGGKLKRIDISGGPPQTITDAANGRGGSWGPDNVILFTPNKGVPIFRVSASGGEAVAVTKIVPGQIDHRFPHFLPDGRRFLFWALGDAAGIYLGSLDSIEAKRLTTANSAGAYVAGWLLFVRQGALIAQRLDLSRGELTGNPITVADSLMPAGTGPGAFSVSPAALITYRSGAASPRQLVWYDRSGKTLGTWGDPDSDGLVGPEISPDGRHVTFNRTTEGKADIWMLDGNGRRTRLTLDESQDTLAVWSPLGTHIAFSSTRRGGFDILG